MRSAVETHLHYWHRDLTPHQVESLEQLVYYHASASAWPVVRVDTDDDVVVVKHLAGIPLWVVKPDVDALIACLLKEAA